MLEVIRAEVGSAATVELLRAGTNSKWFGFRFTEAAALVGVALAIETSALTEGTVLNRTLAQVDEIARIAAFVIKPGKNDPKTIPRHEMAILIRRDQNPEIDFNMGDQDKTTPDSDFALEEPLRWLGRFEHREGELKFVVGENANYFCRFDETVSSGALPVQTPVGLIAKRIFSNTIGKGQIVILRVSELVKDWEGRWVDDTTAGEGFALRAGGYFRLLPRGESTFSTFGGPNFHTSSEPVEAGPYDAGQRLIAEIRLVADRDGRINAHFHEIMTEEQFIEHERVTYEKFRRELAERSVGLGD